MNSDKAREWLQTVGVGLFIPAAVAWLAYSSATREVNAKMIEVAAQVLTGPVNDSMRPVRQWASKMLQHYSPVPFTDTAAATLARYPLVLGPLPGLTPIPLTEGPTQLFISPKSVTLRQSDWQDFVAIALTAAGDTALISDLTWIASGGSIAETTTSRRRHYARFTAGAATGDFVVVARSKSWRLADSAFVHIQTR